MMTDDIERIDVRDCCSGGVRTVIGSLTVPPGRTAHTMQVRLIPPAWRGYARRSLRTDYSDDGRTVTVTITDEKVPLS